MSKETITMDFKNRIKHAWNAFMGRDPTPEQYQDIGVGYSSPPITQSQRSYTDRSIINSIYNKIARDVAVISFVHCRTDKNGNYVEAIKSPLQECLKVEANLDQTGPALIQDAVTRMLKQGTVAIVPTDCDHNPDETGTFDIYQIQCADILEWYPKKIKVNIWNPIKGRHEERFFEKETAAIVTNPMYDIMNEPNSILQRINKKLALLDVIDNESASTKLNMIVQVPYNTRSTMKQDYANRRINEIEEQLADSPRGIAYMDINEKLIQLSRPLENNLLEHIKYLMDTYKQQLGISDELLNGQANEVIWNNYVTSIIEPICVALTLEMKRKWLTQTARTKGQSIVFFKDPFRYVPTTEIAKIADVFSRNQIMTPNELRQKVGMPPSDDPKADELNNANMPDYPEADYSMMPEETMAPEEEQYMEDQNEVPEEEPMAEEAEVEPQEMTPEEFIERYGVPERKAKKSKTKTKESKDSGDMFSLFSNEESSDDKDDVFSLFK